MGRFAIGKIFLFFMGAMTMCMAFGTIDARCQPIKLLTFSTSEDVDSKISYAILSEAYARLGITTMIRFYPPARALVEADSGRTDGEVQRISGLESKYPNLIRVEVPINEARVSVCSKNPDLRINGWESIRGMRIGARLGIKLFEQKTKGWDNIFTAHTQERLFDLLVHDRIDVVVGGQWELMRNMNNHPGKGLHLAKEPIQITPVFHYLHKEHADLVPSITAVLREMKQNGRLQAIKKHLLPSYTHLHRKD